MGHTALLVRAGGKAHPPQRYMRGVWVLLLAVALAACSVGSGGTSRTPVATPGTTSPTSALTPTALPAVTYVAIGASDAFGVGTSDPNRDNWPAVLARKLTTPERQIHLVNLGIPGATAALAVRDELPVALDAQPTIVTIWLGVNDLDQHVALDTYIQGLRSLMHAFTQAGRAHVYVGNLPELSLLPYFTARGTPSALRQQTRLWNDTIAAACVAEGATLVDIFAGWSELASHPEYISQDGLHPSTAGADRLAVLFAEAIRSEMG
ncbi:MAG TPA: SGNH/GDSL hydrolase family protein [Ktedonobacterales bacterium]